MTEENSKLWKTLVSSIDPGAHEGTTGNIDMANGGKQKKNF